MRKHYLRYQIVATETEAKEFCERENASGTAYKRKNKPARFTPWTNEKKTETGFICWYYV